jgi:ABC-type multidrug transport system ATPase subunit
MEIFLSKIGKQFNREWIFRDVEFVFPDNSTSVIIGRNGSGKSTLLQVIAGSLLPTKGVVSYRHQGKQIQADQIFTHLAIVAPYLELIEEFTLKEMLRFHFSFKQILDNLNEKTIIDRLAFHSSLNKPIRNYSSGMKQRVKLALALFSKVPLILLDEPTMNLDQEGISWYHDILRDFSGDRTVIICSNLQQTEASFAGQTLEVEAFKS